jgi:hypothetical protein
MVQPANTGILCHAVGREKDKSLVLANKIDEPAVVFVIEIGQVIVEIGKVVTEANLEIVTDVAIDAQQCSVSAQVGQNRGVD